MRATAVRESTRAPAGHSPGKVLAGAGMLIRFILRRDRIKLPAWLLGITVLLFYFATALSGLAETEEGRRRQARAGIGHARSRRATVLAALETCLVVLPIGCRVLTGWWLRSSRHNRLLRALFRPASIVHTHSAGAHTASTRAWIAAVGVAVLIAINAAISGFAVGDPCASRSSNNSTRSGSALGSGRSMSRCP